MQNSLPPNASGQIYNHTQDFTMKVMTFVALAFAIMAVGAYTAPMLPLPSFMFGWPIFILVLGVALTGRWWANASRPMNIIIFALFAYLTGLMFYPLMGYAMATGGEMLIAKALGITACLGLAAGVYAKTTTRDLSGWGGFLMMAFIGLFITSIIQAFWFNSVMEFVISGVGVVLFSAFIAYDIQKLQHYEEGREIEAALGLYLSIFNLFTSVIRLLIAFQND